jgi:hypothetical protein
MKSGIVFVVLALVGAACSSYTPLPIAGGETCFRCRRAVDEPKLAAEMIDPGGRAFKFRTAGCLATYVKQHPGENGYIFVTDFKTGRMLPASKASFVPTMLGEGRERRQEFIAFKASADAKASAIAQGTAATDWDGVVAAAPTN